MTRVAYPSRWRGKGVRASKPAPAADPDAITVALGWPVRALSPNGRAHHFAKAKAKKAAREEGFWATRSAHAGGWPHEGDIAVHLTACPPSHRPDEDNLINSLKSHLDGIADALGVNDRRFLAPTVEWAEGAKADRAVLVRLTRAEGR